jgi:hypothetical protein
MTCLDVSREFLNKHVTRAVLLACFDLCSTFLGPLEMGKANKKKAAARARAGRATIRNNTNQARLPEPQFHLQPEPEFITIDDESDGECGYTGGVNCVFSSDEEEGSWSNDDNSEPEQLGEMEGEELETNLQALKAALDLLEVLPRSPTIFDEILKGHSLRDWENAEKKLGYTGNSSRTQR